MKKDKSVLDKFLNIFTDVHAGEGINALLLFFNLFIILTAYYIIKPVREALILSGSGAEVKSYAAAGQAILLLGYVPLYALLASKFPRKRLINLVTTFFALCLAGFYLLALLNNSPGLKLNIPLDIIFYLWVGIFNISVIAQFWSFANDLYTPEAGKRLFVIVAFGASLGAAMGSGITTFLIEPLGVYQLLLLAGALLIVSLIITNIVDARQKQQLMVTNLKQVEKFSKPLDKSGAFRLVLKHKYLLLIALLMLFINWVNTTGEYILGRIVTETAKEAVLMGTAGGLTVSEYIGRFYAVFFNIVNWTAILMQLFLVSRIIKYLGIRIAILILPMIALGGYIFIAIVPVLAIIRWIKTAENATDYSLQNTVRNILFLPTTREEKYKAKQAIDTFFVRAGDVLSAVLVYVGTAILTFGIKEFALVNTILVFVLLVISFIIGKMNKNLVKADKKI